MRARYFLRFAVISSALALSASLSACLGGTGTDTENGLSIVNGSHQPMANVRIKVRSAFATPDSTGLDPVVGGSANLVTDSNGNVRFFVDRPGKYLIEGRRADSLLFVDTLRASRSNQQTFVIRPIVRLTGRIRLLSGFKTDTGLVFVRGTGLSSPVNADGTYDMGWGPANAFDLTLGLRYGAKPASRAVVKMASRNSTGKILSTLEDLTQSPNEALVYSRDSLTLFKAKAASSNKAVCLATAVVDVAPAYLAPGSIANPTDVIRETGIACGGNAGALIETQSVNASGKFLAKLGDYVLPDTLAWGEETLGRGGPTISFPASQRAVLAACIRAASEGVTYRTTVKGSGEVRVDDLLRGLNCLAETPKP